MANSTHFLEHPCENRLTTTPHLLPAAVQEMAARIGLEHALRIASALGGVSRLIPIGRHKRSLAAVQKLIDDVGCQDSATALIKHYGGQVLYVPNCAAANRAIRDNLIHHTAELGIRSGRGMNSIVASLAKDHSLSDRRIWEILKSPVPATCSSKTVVEKVI